MEPTGYGRSARPGALHHLRSWLEDYVAPAIDRRATYLHAALILAFSALFVATAWFLTLEPDEAWILSSTAHAFGAQAATPIEAGSPTITTGGPYLIAHGPLARLTMDVFAHRLVSLFATLLFLALVYRMARSLGHPAGRAMAASALFAAAPGFALQAGLATGEVIATLFLVAGALYWVSDEDASVRRTAIAGLLIGSACAARLNCVAALPALMMFALSSPKPGGRAMIRATKLILASAVVVAVSAASYYYAEHDPAVDAYVGRATGIGESAKSFGTVIRALDIANSFIPIVLVAGVAVAWVALRFSSRGGQLVSVRSRDAVGVLLLMGVTMLGAWAIIAPFPHLRYLWPSVACIWLAAILLLLEVWRRTPSPIGTLGLHAFVVVVSMPSLLDGLLAVSQGESSLLVHHAMGMTPQHPMDRGQQFRAAKDQRALAAFVASQPASTRFVAMIPFFAYSTTYLSGREVLKASETTGPNRILLMLPSDHAIARPDPSFAAWRQSYTTPMFRSGDVAAFRIADDAPPPKPGVIYAGQNDIY